MAGLLELLSTKTHQLTGGLFGADPPVSRGALFDAGPARDALFPGPADVMTARQYNQFYGTPLEAYTWPFQAVASQPTVDQMPRTDRDVPAALPGWLNNPTPVGHGLSDVIMREAIAARRSAITSLGFDPSQIAHTGRYGYNAGAVYPDMPGAPGNAMQGRGDITHESTHRGIQALRAAGVPLEIRDTQGQMRPFGPRDEEMLVRRLMQKTMGDVEAEDGGRPAAITARLEKRTSYRDNLDEALEILERAAARQIAQRRPGGPR